MWLQSSILVVLRSKSDEQASTMDQCLTLAISAQNFCTRDVQITQTVNTHEYENPELSTLHTPYSIPPITEKGYLSLHSGGTTRTCYSLLPTTYSTYVPFPFRRTSSQYYILRTLLSIGSLLACLPASHPLITASASSPDLAHWHPRLLLQLPGELRSLDSSPDFKNPSHCGISPQLCAPGHDTS